jgi:hypothetical protein
MQDGADAEAPEDNEQQDDDEEDDEEDEMELDDEDEPGAAGKKGLTPRQKEKAAARNAQKVR